MRWVSLRHVSDEMGKPPTCLRGMKDPTTTSSLDGAISELPGKLDRLLRQGHGCTLPKGVADEVPLIKGDLEKIVAISSDLEDNHAMTARCWRKEVRELSYDMEDFVDQYEYAHAASCSRSMIRSRKITQQQRKSKIRLPWLREKLGRRLWMANKIREFSRRTQEALQRHSMYNLDAIAGASASSRHSSAYYDPAWKSTPCGEENAYVGISDAMEKLLMMMHDDHGHQKLKVVSIVGFGGIGKTTLATELYRKLGQQFECRAFVRTSQKPDMRRIFISMLSQVRPHQPPDNWTVHSLISTIRTHLQDKRYLIIVEDLCTASTWDIVKYALPDSNCCSRILTTTEIEDLALQSCDHDPKYVYKMKPLGEDNSRKLFFGLVFGPQHECPPELREISCNIISKCGGLPLAIVTVASILSSQPGVQGQWDYVNKSIDESLLTNPTWEGMKQVLDLSYNNLPQQLKACILYTSLYEEDIIIWKDDLVNQWIAEGFIQTTGGQDKKEIGRSFFDRLIGGKLILPVDINRNGEVLSYVVHRMVLNLVIRDKSMEENFVTAIHHSQADTTLADKVRRLSLQFSNAEDAIPPSNMRLSHIRTLAFSGVFKCLPSIEQFRLLQVLILHFWGDKDIISFDITRISGLFRLRYLKVTSNVTVQLGTQMRYLQCLETLAIGARVSAVPSDIVQLSGLLHLSLPAETNLSSGIGRMTSLRTLGYFDLSSNSLENVQSLSMLTNLGDLQLTCSTQEPESLNTKTPFLLMNMILERLSNLKSLTLVPTRTSGYTNSMDDDTGVTCMAISDGFSTLSSDCRPLQSLEVSPRICIFFCTPKWIEQLRMLSILKFGVRIIHRDGIDVLRGLPALAELSLYVHTKPAARIVIGKTGFPVIMYFKFKCCDPLLKFEEGAMPNLRELKLAFNVCDADRHSTIPIGLKYLSQLKEVSVKIGGAGPEECQRRATELAFRDAIRVNSMCQRVNVQCVKQIIGGEDDQSSMTEVEFHYLAAWAPPAPPPQRRNQHDSMSREEIVSRTLTTYVPYEALSLPFMREIVSRTLTTYVPYEDGYQWIEAGSSLHLPRCWYYNCINKRHLNCRATKEVQQHHNDDTAPLYVVKYVEEHTCVAAQARALAQAEAEANTQQWLTDLLYGTPPSKGDTEQGYLVLGVGTKISWPPQKRRDWNTFLQYLRNHRPPLTLARCSVAHVIEFLKYLDWLGMTKVHADGCASFGQPKPPPAPCQCQLHQDWGSLTALISRLRDSYKESGHARENKFNPFAARDVRMYLQNVVVRKTPQGIPYETKNRERVRRQAAASPGDDDGSSTKEEDRQEDGKSPRDKRRRKANSRFIGPEWHK